MAEIPKRLQSDRGFTLVEMVAAMAILTIAVAAFTQLFAFTIKRSGTTQEQATIQVETRSALDAFARDLRGAFCNNLTPPVTTATASQISFYTPDEQTPYHLRQVSYQFTSGNFQREQVLSTNDSTTGPPWTMPSLSTATWSTLFGSAANTVTTSTIPFFTYRDANGNTTSVLSAITQVDVAFTVTPRGTTSVNDGTTPYTLSVDIRTPTCETD
jgi:prepilin-type N-terminal cleavage/methylation domain-containing protein